MARDTTLGSLLQMLRAEARLSLNVAHNQQVRDTQVDALRRTQILLWEDYTWPHLRVDRYIDLQDGQRYYDPTQTVDVNGNAKTDLKIDNVERIAVMDGGDWRPLKPFIGRDQYVQFQSDNDVRSWPVSHWQVSEGEQIEFWPIPNANASSEREGQVKLTGKRNLRRLVDDGDRADLDDRLIAMFAAVEFITDPGLAKYKNNLANRRLMKLQGNMVKERKFRMFGGGSDTDVRRPRRMTAIYNAPSS